MSKVNTVVRCVGGLDYTVLGTPSENEKLINRFSGKIIAFDFLFGNKIRINIDNIISLEVD